MGILKNFFTGASLSDSKRQSFQQRLEEEEKTRVRYRAVCKVCGRSFESSDPGRAIQVVQNNSYGGSGDHLCRSGNHDIQVFQI
ncbi:MAG: hypothetical protein SO369_10505 [Treponema sp.]|nr:hypothetical protein [Spirochaetia bacterium]MDY4675410.1 hypothetical protein [Treponema sp.]